MKQDNTKLAVKCNNGTFVGKETDELIIWKGIPYATQPVGKLRWKKALPAADDDWEEEIKGLIEWNGGDHEDRDFAPLDHVEDCGGGYHDEQGNVFLDVGFE